jgi:hypothetical protein
MNDFTFTKNTFENRGSDYGIFAISSIQNKFETNIRLNKLVLVTINADEYLPNTANGNNSFLFLDFGISFTPKENKSEFRLTGKNILGVDMYTTFQNNDFSISKSSINILPRLFSFNFTYSF